MIKKVEALCQRTYFDDIMHQRQLEHPIKTDFVIFQDVLKRPFGAIFSQQARHDLDDCSIEPHQVVVLNVFHSFQLLHELAI